MAEVALGLSFWSYVHLAQEPARQSTMQTGLN